MKTFNRVFTVIVFLFLYIPMIVLAVASFNAGTDIAVWKGFTFAQYGAPKLGRPGLADGVELGIQSVSQQDEPVIDLARDALQLAALAFDELLLLGQLALH